MKSQGSPPGQIWGLMDTPALAAPPTTCSTICRRRTAVATLRFDGNAAHRRSAVVEVTTSALTRPRFPLCPLPRAAQGATTHVLKRGSAALGLAAQSRFMAMR
jgi:hypothetical protein